MCKELRIFPRYNLRRVDKTLFLQLPPAAFLDFFWELSYPRSTNCYYYLGSEKFNPIKQEHLQALYGFVFNIRRPPFTLLQSQPDGGGKKHILRTVCLNQYSVHVIHNYIGQVQKIAKRWLAKSVKI
jgi:hypothetical protein